MAYMSQENKKKIEPLIKAAFKKYGLKGSLSVDNHSTLVLTIKSGKIDFIENFNSTIANDPHMFGRGFQPAVDHIDVNPYHYEKHFNGIALEALNLIIRIMNAGNHDKSDIMTDYFDVGWYISLKIGKWNKPYVLEK